MEVHCPACGAVIYSRRGKLCGVCNAHLPEQLRITGEQADRIASQVQQAQDSIRRIRSQRESPSGGGMPDGTFGGD